ncbi:MAG: DUF2835 domain-containing protein [Thioalkalivibrionaceae bacterium]
MRQEIQRFADRGEREVNGVVTNRMRVYVELSVSEWLRYYAGHASQVLVVDEQGRRIAFPASALRPYTRHDGVRGWFWIEFDDSNRLIAVTPASPSI